MTAALLVAAVALLGVGSAASAASRTFRAGLAAQAVGAALLGAVGFWALATGATFGSSFTSGFTPRFGVDGLTAFFLGTLGLVANDGASGQALINAGYKAFVITASA